MTSHSENKKRRFHWLNQSQSRVLAQLLFLALFVMDSSAQIQSPLSIADQSQLVSLSPSGIKSAVLTNGGGVFRWDSTSLAATNTSTIFKPLSLSTGRWVAVSPIPGVSLTELGYVAGVSSAIQTQINDLAGASAATKMNTNAGTSWSQTAIGLTVSTAFTNSQATASRAAYFDSAKRLTNVAHAPNFLWAYGGVPGDGNEDSTALTAALAAVDDVVITKGEWELSTSTTIAATKRLIFEEGAYFKIRSGVTLTISGDIDAGPVKIFQFSGTGTVLFPKIVGGVGQSRVRNINALWYAIGNSNGSNDQSLFDLLVGSVESGASAEIYLPAGVYNITNTLRIKSGMQIVGATEGFLATQINHNPTGPNIPAFAVEADAVDFGLRNLTLVATSGSSITNVAGLQITNSTTRGVISKVKFGNFNGAGIRTLGNNLYLTVRDCFFVLINNSATTGNNLTPAIALDATNTLGACSWVNNKISQCDKGIHVRGNASDSSKGFNSFLLMGGSIESCGRQDGPNDYAAEFENGTGVTIIGTHFEANKARAAVQFKNISDLNWSGGLVASDFGGTIYSTNSIIFDNFKRGTISGVEFNNTGNKFIIVTNSPSLPTRIDAIGCNFDLGTSVQLIDTEILSRVDHPHVVLWNWQYRGTGAAESSVQAFIGSLRSRADGNGLTAIEAKVSGTNTTGWGTIPVMTNTATTNALAGVNSAGTSGEYKVLTAGTNIVIGHTAGAITINSSASGSTSPTTTQGDLIRRGASADERLALGEVGAVLMSDGTDAVWSAPSRYVTFKDEFISVNGSANQAVSEFGFIGYTVGSGSRFYSLLGSTEPGRIGIADLQTGTTTTGAGALFAGAAGTDGNLFLFGGGEWTLEWSIKIVALSDGTDTYSARIGFGDTRAADFTDGVYFEYDSTASVNWRCKTASNASRTTTNTGTAVSTDWVNLKIVVNAAGTSAGFYINGSLVHTETLTIPTGAGRWTGITAHILKSAGTTTRSMYLDYVWGVCKLTTPR